MRPAQGTLFGQRREALVYCFPARLTTGEAAKWRAITRYCKWPYVASLELEWGFELRSGERLDFPGRTIRYNVLMEPFSGINFDS